MPKVAKLGESNQPEGIYIEAGSDGGGRVDGGETIEIERGGTLPLTQKPNRGWVRK